MKSTATLLALLLAMPCLVLSQTPSDSGRGKEVAGGLVRQVHLANIAHELCTISTEAFDTQKILRQDGKVPYDHPTIYNLDVIFDCCSELCGSLIHLADLLVIRNMTSEGEVRDYCTKRISELREDYLESVKSNQKKLNWITLDQKAAKTNELLIAARNAHDKLVGFLEKLE